MNHARMCVAIVLIAGVVQTAAGQELTERDRLRIAVQDICPVTGEKLESMGDPIKVSVGESKEEVFLCCKGCLKKSISPEHWATIHTNIAKAQGRCPIMKKELPAGAKWTVVQGEVIYVCCPPCIKKIVVNPDASLKQVDAYYAAYLSSIQQAR